MTSLPGDTLRLPNTVARPNPDRNFVERLLSDQKTHRDHMAEHCDKAPDQETACAEVKAIVRCATAVLEALEREHAAAERAEFEEAVARALVPEYSPLARLLPRGSNQGRPGFEVARGRASALN